MIVGELIEMLLQAPADKVVGVYDEDGDVDELLSVDVLDDAVVLKSMFASVPEGRPDDDGCVVCEERDRP